MLLRAFLLFVALIVLWLLLSGLWDNVLVTGLGVVSCILCVWIVHRLRLLDGEMLTRDFKIFAGINYVFWLLVEIGKADWAVTKVILAKDLPRRQRLLKVGCQQRTDIGRALFANSITITPGTVTVEAEEDCFIVHALTDEAANMGGLDGMGAKVAAIEAAR